MADTQNVTDGPDRAANRCADIQALLFEFVAHELDAARADIVRRHLERCPTCRAEAAELRETMIALRAATPAEPVPEHVSPDRRARLVWAFMHPVRTWVRSHHLLTSVAVAAILFAIAWLVVRRIDPMREVPRPDVYDVEIGLGDAPPRAITPVGKERP